jgi:hypothetical protein
LSSGLMSAGNQHQREEQFFDLNFHGFILFVR